MMIKKSGSHDLTCSHDDSKKNKSARPSGFRAVNTKVPQKVGPADLTQIKYPEVQFDLKHEYNPKTSTFTPKHDGVYSIIASIGFISDVPTDYSVRIFIVVNGVLKVADNDFLGEQLPIVNLVSVSTILKLSSGDDVQVFAQATTDGTTETEPLENTVFFMNFQAARFPS